MTPRQWSRVYELFAKATTLDPEERPAFLKRACRNPEVRREVESLLAQHDKGVNFPGVYSSIGGKVLSHYEIGEQIGKGGISIVYKARDARLQRWVALKVLQPWAMGHSRFRQLLIKEAQAASALNHPNIVTIHEAAEENGVGFIVMEYVAGKT